MLLQSIALAVALLAAPQPKSINLIVQITDGTGVGFGTPIGPQHVLTANHLLTTNTVSYRRGADTGAMEPVWKDIKTDVAILKLATGAKPFINWALVAKKPAETGDKVYYRILLFGENAISWTEGIVLGVDEEGDLVINGWFHPGTSGTGVFNAQGELVGVMNSGVNWSASRGVGVDMLKNLFVRTSFPPAMVVTPVNRIKGLGK